MRQLWSKARPGIAEYIEQSEVTEKWSRPAKSMREAVLRKLPVMLSVIPVYIVCHYLQYINDVHQVNMVKYDVKLHPVKPKVTIWDTSE